MAKVYAGDVGTKIQIDTATDLSDAELVSLSVKIVRTLDDHSTSVSYADWSADILDPPTEGLLEHVIQQGELALAGEYLIAARVSFQGGAALTGETAMLNVYGPFE